MQTWKRCREHTAVIELAQFLLSLPPHFDEDKVNLILDVGGKEATAFDLNSLMY